MWVRGDAFGFWMEDDIPQGIHDNYVFDFHDWNDYDYNAKVRLFRLLSKLKVLDYGTIYESAEAVRIKVR